MRLLKLIVVPVVFLIASSIAYCDVIELKTGQRVDGSIRQMTASDVVIEVGGQKISFPREKVRAIYLGTIAPQTQVGDGTPEKAVLSSLRSLDSVAKGNASQQEFATRVNEVKIKVDDYLRTGPDGRFKTSVDAAMGYYLGASKLWSIGDRPRRCQGP